MLSSVLLDKRVMYLYQRRKTKKNKDYFEQRTGANKNANRPTPRFSIKTHHYMQNLTANLLVINSTHFEKNFIIFGTDYLAILFTPYLPNILMKIAHWKYQIISFDRALQALQPGIIFSSFGHWPKNFLYWYTV